MTNGLATWSKAVQRPARLPGSIYTSLEPHSGLESAANSWRQRGPDSILRNKPFSLSFTQFHFRVDRSIMQLAGKRWVGPMASPVFLPCAQRHSRWPLCRGHWQQISDRQPLITRAQLKEGPSGSRRQVLLAGAAPVWCCACGCRNTAMDRLFAQSMAEGMGDYEAAIAPLKASLFRQLCEGLQSRAEAGRPAHVVEVGIGTGALPCLCTALCASCAQAVSTGPPLNINIHKHTLAACLPQPPSPRPQPQVLQPQRHLHHRRRPQPVHASLPTFERTGGGVARRATQLGGGHG